MSSLKTRRVLIVEDDPVVAMVVEDTLRGMGLETLVNLSLFDALNELETSDIDAAFIDMGLRGESAHPVVLDLVTRGIPVVVMSGKDQPELRAEFPQIRIVLKPLSVQALQEITLELLDIQRSALKL
ncbi:response regulator [Rhodanobacter sp. MP7CTX1]|uniref:response regulator n=1 Tax=Rhodanobacter sp. MP7CTX1 TaxID=2723084 RepID=UPI00160C8C86|nr:response regulator [Rhodanobacter sp. MP7CTX1]MBB6186083.1 CheY-like chemotaxis protein [Rhodanobacter sp. MP7CTX1]